MSGVAICVGGLSKRFRLGARQGPYRTLRESLMNGLASLLAWRAKKATEVVWALQGVSFTVARGEVVGIIGRNGAGKTTLLKILSRITEPTAGFAEIHGRVGSLLEVGSGFHPELTGRENIFLNGAILGMRRAEIVRKFDEIVAFAEVERFIDTPVKRFSSGMYLRLAFAVAAHLDPEILLVDEVLAVGDLSFQNKCLAKMQEVSSGGRTVLFVSHNLGAIHRLCPRTILLREGRVAAEGTTDHVIEAYLAEGLEQRPEYVQPPDSSKAVHLRRACLMTTDGVLTSEFRYDQAIRVRVEYEVNARVQGCSIWVGIWTVEEEHAFDTADTDAPGVGAAGDREPGYYIASVDLPRCWLNAGRYTLVVGIARLGVKLSYDRVELSTFSVSEVGIPASGRRGILQPMLSWRTVSAPRAESGR